MSQKAFGSCRIDRDCFTNGAGLKAWNKWLNTDKDGARIGYTIGDLGNDRYVIYIPTDQREKLLKYLRQSTFPVPDGFAGNRLTKEQRQELFDGYIEGVVNGSASAIFLVENGGIATYSPTPDQLLAARNVARKEQGLPEIAFKQKGPPIILTPDQVASEIRDGLRQGGGNLVGAVEKTVDTAGKVLEGGGRVIEFVAENPGESLLRVIDGAASALEAVGDAVTKPIETTKRIIKSVENKADEVVKKFEEDPSKAFIELGVDTLVGAGGALVGGRILGKVLGEGVEGAGIQKAEGEALKKAEGAAVKVELPVPEVKPSVPEVKPPQRKFAPEKKLIDDSRPLHGTPEHDATAWNKAKGWESDPATVESRFNQDLVDASGKRIPEFRPDAQRIRITPDGRRVVDVTEVISDSQKVPDLKRKLDAIKKALGPDAGEIELIDPVRGAVRNIGK